MGKYPPEDCKVEKVNTILLRNAIFYARNIMIQNQTCEGDEFIKKDFFQPTFKFSNKLLNLVIKYSQFNLPVDMNDPLNESNRKA